MKLKLSQVRFHRLIEAIPSLNADLLVLGTHGLHGFNRFLLGNVAEETIRRSPIPTLVISPLRQAKK